MTASLTIIARRLGFVREADGPNAGAWVEFIQRFSGGAIGESWCAYFVSLVLDIAYHGKPPLTRSGMCSDLLAQASRHGWVVTDPQPDDLYFYVTDAGHAHHIGVVTASTPLTGIAGNTSVDGQSSNGIGVFEHVLNVTPTHIVFVRLPK
jgi:hypothetical protein